jgi:hypothetical protein
MKDFLFLYRVDPTNIPKGSPEEMQALTKRWMDWIGGIAAQNRLSDRGNRLEPTGKVVNPGNMITDGPYTEIKETLGGYTVIKAASLDEAVKTVKGCPILEYGGNVEVREVSVL